MNLLGRTSISANAACAIVLSLAAVLIASGAVHAQGIPAPAHLVDTYYSFPESSETAVDFTSVQGDDGNYYVSLNSWFSGCEGSECIAYGGLQTNGFDGSKWIGKMAIFSVWNATIAEPEDGVTATPFSGEGVGYSLRFPFDWQVGGSYRFTMKFDGYHVSGLPYLSASIIDLSNASQYSFGKIVLPGSYTGFYGAATFHEHYATELSSCGQDTPSIWKLGDVMTVGGVPHSSYHYIQSDHIKSYGCEDYIWVERSSGVLSHSGVLRNTEVSNPIEESNTPPVQSAVPDEDVDRTEAIASVVELEEALPDDSQQTETDLGNPTLEQDPKRQDSGLARYGFSFLTLIGVVVLAVVVMRKRAIMPIVDSGPKDGRPLD